MPTPTADETREHFMERCIPMVMDDGAAEDNEQAVAMCSNIWKRAHEPKGEQTMEYSNPIQITEFKADGDDWLVEGYVSTFGNTDLGGDVVMPGAFKETLKSGPKVKFLLAHDQSKVLGVPRKLKEDNKGLFGSFKISKTQLGEDTHQLLLDGAIDSFSFGYHADDWKIVDGEFRQLYKLTLYEASLVAVPMNMDATVTRVKEYSTLAERAGAMNVELEDLLNDLRGLVKSIDRPLSETKRQEITLLLEKFSGLDAVRSEFQTVLTAAPQPKLVVAGKRASYDLAEARKRLARILAE